MSSPVGPFVARVGVPVLSALIVSALTAGFVGLWMAYQHDDKIEQLAEDVLALNSSHAAALASHAGLPAHSKSGERMARVDTVLQELAKEIDGAAEDRRALRLQQTEILRILGRIEGRLDIARSTQSGPALQ